MERGLKSTATISTFGSFSLNPNASAPVPQPATSTRRIGAAPGRPTACIQANAGIEPLDFASARRSVPG